MENTFTWITGIIAAINAAVIAYAAYRRLKPEVKKLETEVETDNVEAANLNLEGAKISAQMLLDRINELKGELTEEKKLRRESISLMEAAHGKSIKDLERARQSDREYFRRRIKDLETESRDYRQWAAKLVKQVVEAGKVPVPFVPSVGESETGITAIRTDLEGTTEEKKAINK